jgi:hypothetical protein
MGSDCIKGTGAHAVEHGTGNFILALLYRAHMHVLNTASKPDVLWMQCTSWQTFRGSLSWAVTVIVDSATIRLCLSIIIIIKLPN